MAIEIGSDPNVLASAATAPPESNHANMSKRPSFKHLFVFRRGTQTSVICGALVTAGVVALTKTLYAVALGTIFEILTQFGSATIGADEFLSGISRWCLYLVALGGGMLIFSGLDMGLWVTSGELGARTAREELFSSLMKKTMAWYDSREDGNASLLVGVQT